MRSRTTGGPGSGRRRRSGKAFEPRPGLPDPPGGGPRPSRELGRGRGIRSCRAEELRAWNRFVHVGEGLYQIGEIRRLRGDVAGAEKAFRDAGEMGRDPQPGLSLLMLQQGKVDAAAGSIEERWTRNSRASSRGLGSFLRSFASSCRQETSTRPGWRPRSSSRSPARTTRPRCTPPRTSHEARCCSPTTIRRRPHGPFAGP